MNGEANSSRYTPEESDWLKESFGKEFHFLREHGLSIYKDEDREEGRSIVRGYIKAENSLKVPQYQDEEANTPEDDSRGIDYERVQEYVDDEPGVDDYSEDICRGEKHEHDHNGFDNNDIEHAKDSEYMDGAHGDHGYEDQDYESQGYGDRNHVDDCNGDQEYAKEDPQDGYYGDECGDDCYGDECGDEYGGDCDGDYDGDDY